MNEIKLGIDVKSIKILQALNLKYTFEIKTTLLGIITIAKPETNNKHI